MASAPIQARGRARQLQVSNSPPMPPWSIVASHERGGVWCEDGGGVEVMREAGQNFRREGSVRELEGRLGDIDVAVGETLDSRGNLKEKLEWEKYEEEKKRLTRVRMPRPAWGTVPDSSDSDA
mmetsp:Transcript_56982/g.83585  ORF Transcript_56982/g.83585 Transcript_56982/m.83585 type:complete len:123 (+) Transcript_56982:690-1058(+)